jgi:hypothetical protein
MAPSGIAGRGDFFGGMAARAGDRRIIILYERCYTES